MQGGPAACRQRNALQRADSSASLQGAVFADGGVGERSGLDLSELEPTDVDEERSLFFGKFEDRVVAEVEIAVEVGDLVFLINRRCRVVDCDDLLNTSTVLLSQRDAEACLGNLLGAPASVGGFAVDGRRGRVVPEGQAEKVAAENLEDRRRALWTLAGEPR